MTDAVRQSMILGVLASVLGSARAQTVWSDAAQRLSVPPGPTCPREKAQGALQSLVKVSGPVGLAARLAMLRLEEEAPAPPLSSAASVAEVHPPADPEASPPEPAPVPSVGRPSESPPSSSFRVEAPPRRPSQQMFAILDAPTSVRDPRPSAAPGSARNLVDLLSFFVPALGQQRSTETLAHYRQLLNLPPGPLPHEDAIRLLDAIALVDGVAGVVARLARAKVVARRPI